MTSRVFVTGGSGFVGSRLLAALRSHGYAVAALDRSGTLRRRAMPNDGVDVVHGDLLSPNTYAGALSASDVVLHLAATTGRASRDSHFRVNAEGTEALLDQCRRGGPSRILFTSSIAVTFEDTRDYYYAQAKLRAETAVKRSGLSYAILRPTMILGPGSPILESLEKLASLPVIPVFGDGLTQVQPVHVDDVVRSIVSVLEDDLFSNTTFEVGGPEVLTIEELLQRIREARGGRPARVMHLALGMVLPPLRMAESLGLGGLLPLSAGQLSSFRSDGTIEADTLHEWQRVELRDMTAVLRQEEAGSGAPCASDASVDRECHVFTRYLVGLPPNEYVSRKYVAARAALPALSSRTRFDEFLVAAARRHPILTRLADSYARVFASESALRCRLVLLLAVLETCPPSYRAIDEAVGGPTALVVTRLAWQAAVAILSLLVGVLVFSPARLVLAVAGSRSR
jgi:NADH dehydrogenase